MFPFFLIYPFSIFHNTNVCVCVCVCVRNAISLDFSSLIYPKKELIQFEIKLNSQISVIATISLVFFDSLNLIVNPFSHVDA